uniref:DNA excision repair protein ERCC-1 n=1 Tax=Neogobius melanostomus TaxID=47308 RepID=A0A8C6S517_9GOBI
MKKRFNINLDDSTFTKDRTPLKPQFKSSSNGEEASDVSSAAGQPMSYAQYIVQSKSKATVPLEKDRSSSKLPGPEHCPEALNSASSTAQGGQILQDCAKTTDEEAAPSDRKDEGVQISGPKPVGSGSSILVSPRQRGNPILKYVRSVPWEFGEVVPDYVLGQTTCALFLSLRYHNLNPNYIHERLKQLGSGFVLRVLLLQVDVVKRPHHALKELARICIMADCTLVLAWSPEEAGRYLETYKSYEKKPADLLKEQVEKDYLSKVTDCMTTVKSINKTDAITLLSTFSSVEGVINASKEDLVLCPGLGPQKARRLHDVLHKPFIKSKTKD